MQILHNKAIFSHSKELLRILLISHEFFFPDPYRLIRIRETIFSVFQGLKAMWGVIEIVLILQFSPAVGIFSYETEIQKKKKNRKA